MNTTTLRGIFPEARPVYARNFVRENIKQLKEMQGFINDSKVTSKSQIIKPDKFRHVAPKVYSFMNTRKKSKETLAKRPVSYNQIKTTKSPLFRKPKLIISKGVQTERPEDVAKMYESGKTKTPTSAVGRSKQSTQRTKDQGDVLAKSMQKLDLDEKHNYIKENIKNIKANRMKMEAPDPTLAPTGYQKGAIPRYLKEKKVDKLEREEILKPIEFEGENISGLVLLPDEERKEYLRVARENYAALIKELNTMPMSNDTLKKRKRKMEIEDELRRLDEVIKIFQKPKVFVKADA